jgi:preprotein translocase subunit SecE
MARSRPARGQGTGSGDDKGAPAPPRARRTPAGAGARPAPRPNQPARRKPDKAGTVTKTVQQKRGSRFLSEVVAEMRKVSWPTRPVLLQSTAVVLLVVAIVSAYLAVLDEIFGRLVDTLF